MNNKLLNLVKIVLFFAIILTIGVALNSFKSLLPFNKDINRLLLEGSALIAIFLSYYFFMTKWDKKALPNKQFKLSGYGFLIGAAMLIAVFIVNNLLRSIDPTYFGLSFTNIGIYFVTMLFTATWEEIAFRGYLLQKLSETIGIHTSCILVALSFGLLHLLGPLISYQIVISTFLSGMLLNYAYFYAGNLYLPIGIHFGWNFFNGLLFSEKIFKIEYLNPLLAGTKNPEQGLIAIIMTGVIATSFLLLYIKKQIHGHGCAIHTDTYLLNSNRR